MATPTQITNFRLSFIWIETVPAVLARTLDTKQSFAFLGSVGSYAEKFDESKSSAATPSTASAAKPPADPAQPAAEPLTVPWLGSSNHYWKYTFARQSPRDVTGATAWQSLVPLRVSLQRRYALAPAEMKVTFEGFYSPAGIALVANAYYRGKARTPMEIAEVAQFIRHQAQFNPVATPTLRKALTATADDLIGSVRRSAFGATPAYAGSNQPFSIATVVQGTVADAAVAVAPGSDEHRALAAVSTWKQDYRTMSLGAKELDEATLDKAPGTASDLIYATKTARAVWLPREFTRTGLVIRRMSCYHRNLTLCTVQTLLLGELVDRVYKWIQGKQPIAPLLLQRAKQAALFLDKSANGDKTLAYRTLSVVKLIDTANWRPSIDHVKAL